VNTRSSTGRPPLLPHWPSHSRPAAKSTAWLDAELGKAKVTASLRLWWADGTQWLLDVPRTETEKARSLLDQLETVS
jgi:hypothetical protein